MMEILKWIFCSLAFGLAALGVVEVIDTVVKTRRGR